MQSPVLVQNFFLVWAPYSHCEILGKMLLNIGFLAVCNHPQQ